MYELAHWYRSEVQRWRTGASIAWTMLVFPLFVYAYLLLATVSMIHPYQWIIGWIVNIFSVSTWGYITIAGVVLVITAAYDSAHYTVIPEVLTTRLAILRNIVHPSRLLHGMGHGLAGGVIAWSLVCLSSPEYASLTQTCTQDSSDLCLNEHHLFIVLQGVFTGYMYSLQFFHGRNNYITFPSIQRAKFFQVKSSVFPMVYKSVCIVLSQLKYFYVGYFLLGSIPRDCIVAALQIKTREVPVGSLRGLFDLSLFWLVLLGGTVIHLMLSLSALLYKVYNTEACTFPVESYFDQDRNKCLHNALACSAHPLVQYLGYLDLYHLSQHSFARRKEVFNLSQPGGHPHNWNYISTECIAAIEALTNSVVVYNNSAIANGALRQMSGDSTTVQAPVATPATSFNISSSGYAGSLLLSPGASAATPVHRATPNNNYVPNGSFVSPAKLPSGAPPQAAQPSSFSKFWSQFKKRPAVAFFLSDLPDTTSRKLFANSQLQIWALEALSSLVSASYSEDSFGVVQQSLPDVLTAMINLQEAVDKHFKVSTNISRRPVKESAETSDASLRFAVRSALKTSIHRIGVTFDKHLGHIPLSPEHVRRLRLFMEYKE